MPVVSPPTPPRRQIQVSRRLLLTLVALPALPLAATAAPQLEAARPQPAGAPAPAASAGSAATAAAATQGAAATSPAGATPASAPASQAVPADNPAAPIAALYQALERLMRQGPHSPFVQRFNELMPVIDRVFDLQDILSLSVGVRWSSLDDAERAKLFKAFRTFTVATYVANFDSYDGERFELLAGERSVGADRVVATQLIQSNGKPVRLDYVMRRHEQKWQVVDVLLDATISRVAVQRSDFRALLADGGADALIKSLRRKTQDLSGGAQLGS